MKWTPLVIVISIIAILSVPFLWNNPLSLSEIIDPAKMSAWATLLAATFTSITVYLLYRQNIELSKEKVFAVMPQIFIKTNYFTVRDQTETMHDDLIIKYNDNELVQINKKEPVHIPIFSGGKPFGTHFGFNPIIEIENVGLGTALQLKFFWSYDVGKITKLLEGKYNWELKDLDKVLDYANNIDFLKCNQTCFIGMPSYFMSCLGPSITIENNNYPALSLHYQFRDLYNNLSKFEIPFEIKKTDNGYRFQPIQK